MSPDIINGAFELISGMAMWADVRRLYLDRQIRGVYWPLRVFFAAWGLWNLFYYPHLDQWASFVGGLFLVIANIAWVGMALRYRLKK